jgi:hypothetical protein
VCVVSSCAASTDRVHLTILALASHLLLRNRQEIGFLQRVPTQVCAIRHLQTSPWKLIRVLRQGVGQLRTLRHVHTFRFARTLIRIRLGRIPPEVV